MSFGCALEIGSLAMVVHARCDQAYRYTMLFSSSTVDAVCSQVYVMSLAELTVEETI